MRVWAENGMKTADRSDTSRPRRPKRCLASTTMERPSGVSSARLDSCAASASSNSSTPSTGRNSTAWRLPSVIVPVLSSRRVCTSPDASTARPLIARTLCCMTRSIPAIPIADRSPPIVVGIRQTRRATSTVTEGTVPDPAAAAERAAIGPSVATAIRKISVRPAIRMLSATSFGVFCRRAPSTSAIILSRNVSPGFEVMRTLIQSDSTRVPPVTALRSPPDSRMTGALSPVMTDSSTDATPSTTSPSPGITSCASQSTMSPALKAEAGTDSAALSRRRRFAVTSVLVFRSESA